MYSVYGIAFNWKGSWSLGDNYAGYVVSFDVDNSSSSHTKWIFNIRCRRKLWYERKLWCTKKMFSINFSKAKTKFCLSLHCNGDKSYLFVHGKRI